MSKNEPRWYCINTLGMATLCSSEADARLEAANADGLYPRLAPHRAVQMVEWAAIESAQERQGEAAQLPNSVEGIAFQEICDGSSRTHLRLCMGHGRIEVGDAVHEGLPALWFGNDGQGLGFERDRKGPSNANETLAIITFENLAGLEAIEFAAKRLRKTMSGSDSSPQPLLELSEDRWLDIESAPKDGRLFLCWVSAVSHGVTDEGQPYQVDVSQADFCQWQAFEDAPNGGWFEPCCGQISDHQAVTHWQPLPSPPSAMRAARSAK